MARNGSKKCDKNATKMRQRCDKKCSKCNKKGDKNLDMKSDELDDREDLEGVTSNQCEFQ